MKLVNLDDPRRRLALIFALLAGFALLIFILYSAVVVQPSVVANKEEAVFEKFKSPVHFATYFMRHFPVFPVSIACVFKNSSSSTKAQLTPDNLRELVVQYLSDKSSSNMTPKPLSPAKFLLPDMAMVYTNDKLNAKAKKFIGAIYSEFDVILRKEELAGMNDRRIRSEDLQQRLDVMMQHSYSTTTTVAIDVSFLKKFEVDAKRLRDENSSASNRWKQMTTRLMAEYALMDKETKGQLRKAFPSMYTTMQCANFKVLS